MFEYTKDFINKYIYNEMFGNNIVAILQTGSRFSNKFTDGWSDADYIVVFKKLTSADLHIVREINQRLEDKYRFHFGTSPITETDYISTHTNSLKILLIKMNIALGLTRVVYGISLPDTPPTPNSIDRRVWLHEVNYYKDYLRTGVRDLDEIELSKRCIKCTEYLLLAMCLFYGELPKDIDEKIAILSSKLPNSESDFESLSVIKDMKIEYSKGKYSQDSMSTVIDSLERIVAEFYSIEELVF